VSKPAARHVTDQHERATATDGSGRSPTSLTVPRPILEAEAGRDFQRRPSWVRAEQPDGLRCSMTAEGGNVAEGRKVVALAAPARSN